MFNYTEEICSTCNGSGEGPADGTICWSCQGSGVEWVEDEDNALEN